MEEKMLRIVRDGQYYTVVTYHNGVPVSVITEKYWDLDREDREKVNCLFEPVD